MEKQEVTVVYDVICDWNRRPPMYRLWVNDELFTERTYVWTDRQLEETIAISAPPGDYRVRYELIGDGELRAANPRVIHGPATIIDHFTVRIQP